jgi:hypothetical protein
MASNGHASRLYIVYLIKKIKKAEAEAERRCDGLGPLFRA